MEKRYLTEIDGVNHVNIDITVEEWKQMLEDKSIFNDKSLKMLRYWYEQEGYSAACKEIVEKYATLESDNSKLSVGGFNSIAGNLGKRIKKYLNRFEIFNESGEEKSYPFVFHGWEKANGLFVWQIRSELVQAIKESGLFDNTDVVKHEDGLDSNEFDESRPEGKVRVTYSRQYERDSKNRRTAIQLHGTKCQICGFDFGKFYGKRGEGYIEVHHIKPLYVNDEQVEVDPKKDLICVCSNCHRMFHRKRDYVPTPDELRKEIEENRQKGEVSHE